jgi:hypothetical protein
MKKSVKIIQILQDREPGVVNDILGLGDDGVVYCANWKEQKWKELFPMNFETVTEIDQ